MSVPAPAPHVHQVVPFCRVSDMPRSLRFYVDGIGFTRASEWIVNGEIRWCWLQLGGAALMLQEFHRKDPAAWDALGKHGVGVNLCFQCDDAIALYYQFIARGLSASEPQVGNGLWVTGLVDPDGYLMEFSSPTTVPEETRLSEWTREHQPNQPAANRP